MGGPRPGLVIAAVVAASMLAGMALTIDAPAAEAKKDKTGVACPKKVGPYKLAETEVREDDSQLCDYHQPKRSGWAFLQVRWHADEPGERRRCASREPHFTVEGWGADLDSASHMIEGHVSIGHPDDMSIASAEKPLRKLLAATEALAHPCVPAAPAEPTEGPSCPLLLPHDLVRSDWYFGEAQVAKARGERFILKCEYQPAYVEDGDAIVVEVEWKEGDPSHPALCRVREKEFYGETEYQLGYHPVSVRTSDEFVERWDGQVIADALVAAAAARTQPCPDAPDGPAPYEVDSAAPVTATSTTTIVLGGGPGQERPSVGSTIEVPEVDQHRIVIGGPDGEVIREEFIGDQATINAYGPLVTDADGNWSVLVTVDVTTAPASTAPPTPGPSPALTPAATPERTPAPAPDTPGPQTTTTPTASSPSPEPALESAPATPTEAPGPAASATPNPPPKLIGMPPGIAEIVAGLPPAGAGAVRDVSDHLAVLGELLETEQSGQVTVPASDIGSLRELLPGVVQEVWLTDGMIVVATNKRDIGNIYVKPAIGDDGLIKVNLGKYQIANYYPVVRALVAALNGYVAKHGGRFTSVSVTPEGLVVSAERSTQE